MTSQPVRLAVIGDGKMGRAIAALAPERGFVVVAQFGDPATGARALTSDALKGCDVAIEFTVPTAAAQNVRTCAVAGVPVVVGTTGWESERDAVENAIRTSPGALLAATNFSLGVQAFIEVAREAARRVGTLPAFRAHLVETHHDQKLDAPSGTAKTIAEATKGVLGADLAITSVRVGHVPGTHTLVFDGPFEQVTLTHEARDRRVFADGALAVAAWLVGRRGVFTMRHFLGLDPLP
jgi:4-hydroxy-tetrahydrodipicolinate reductase